MKIKKHVQLQIVGWSIYWLLLLAINVFFFKKIDYSTPLVITWTILFTLCGLIIFYLLTYFYNRLINRSVSIVISLVMIVAASFVGAYLWGLFEPIISWVINPDIHKLNISWDINSRGTFPFTFVVAFFSILYYFSKIVEQPQVQQVAESSNQATGATLDDTISVYLKSNIVLLPFKNIVKISINGNYSSITDSRNIKYELKKPLVKWESDLPKGIFIRIHRSTIINKNYIEKIEPWHNYAYRIKLSISEVPEEVSRRYAMLLRKGLNL